MGVGSSCCSHDHCCCISPSKVQPVSDWDEDNSVLKQSDGKISSSEETLKVEIRKKISEEAPQMIISKSDQEAVEPGDDGKDAADDKTSSQHVVASDVNTSESRSTQIIVSKCESSQGLFSSVTTGNANHAPIFTYHLL